MHLLKLISSIVLLVLIDGYNNVASADTYFIERNRSSIFNHGNPNATGSLAWYFATYGENNRYILTTPASGGSYGVTTPLSLPAGSTLESGTGGAAWLRAYASVPVLLNVSESSTVSGLVLDGDYKAIQVVRGRNVDNFLLQNSIIRRTNNNNLNSVRTRAHLVDIKFSNSVKILNNIVTQAADNGVKVTDRNFLTEASGLYLTNNTNVDVINNTISYVLSAGVNTTNSVNVNILDNVIDNTGRAGKYDLVFGADGITAYHNGNLPPSTNLYYDVQGNTITNWYNHGIHLSGRWLNISNNQVTSPGVKINPDDGVFRSNTGHAIYVGDYRDPIQCSAIIWIQRNHIERSTYHPEDAADGIRVLHYHHPAYWPSQNTGDVGNAINVSDHRFNSIGGQASCSGAYSS